MSPKRNLLVLFMSTTETQSPAAAPKLPPAPFRSFPLPAEAELFQEEQQQLRLKAGGIIFLRDREDLPPQLGKSSESDPVEAAQYYS